MIWLYAVCERLERPLPRVRGLGDRPPEGNRLRRAGRGGDASRVSARGGARAYLRRRRHAAELHQALAAYAVEVRRRPEQRGELVRASYLVEPAALEPFRAAVERLQREHRRLSLVCTGPWPAYSFAEPEWATAS